MSSLLNKISKIEIMKKSQSNLLHYIHVLLESDKELKAFIKNPAKAAEHEDNGLTKAERSVLRRTVAHLPSTSKSNFAMTRTLSSYRRSLRLLQNVLHNSGTKMMGDVLSNGAVTEDSTVFYLVVNYPNMDSGESLDFTCETNDDVNKIGGPYANAQSFQIVFGSGSTTIERLVLGASQAFPSIISYETVDIGGKPYISSITINGRTLKADLSNACYDLSANPDADFVFWFYSVNGEANPNTSGTVGMSFADYQLQSGDTVYLQLIAPDKTYGFQPC